MTFPGSALNSPCPKNLLFMDKGILHVPGRLTGTKTLFAYRVRNVPVFVHTLMISVHAW